MSDMHRPNYHRYFEGYTERKVTDEKGTHIERTYTGEYIKSTLSDHKWKMRKVLYAILGLISIGLWIAVSVLSLPSNFVNYVSIFGAVAIFPNFFLVYSVVYFCIVPRKMTLNQYREASAHLKYATLCSSILLLARDIALVIYLIRSQPAFSLSELFGALGYLIAAVTAFLIFFTEHKAEYIHVPNEKSYMEEMDDASVIDW